MNFQAARDLHRSVPAERWCITRAEFDDFVSQVHESWSANGIPSPSQPPNPLHWDPDHGPNLYDVNTFVVKPMTLAAGGVSYALMKHPEGLECQATAVLNCQIFVGLAGIFHLRQSIRIAWPQLFRLRNLYCCLLSNPQNLDLQEFIGGNVGDSAFALALQKASHLLVVPNPAVGVYSRLWCVFEAYVGVTWNKIYLLPVAPDPRTTWTYWCQRVGFPMACGIAVGFPLWLSLKHFFGGDSNRRGLYSWLELIYRVLTLLALMVVLPCRHYNWSLNMMVFLTWIGSLFLVMDLAWSFSVLPRDSDNWISVFFHYGWISDLTLMNGLTTVLLVILKGGRESFYQQKEMMQFQSLAEAHCSSLEDEERIRNAIAGAEEEVETVIRILLAAGAYTDNLRYAWDNGLNIEKAGMTDVRTGVFFAVLIWLFSSLDLLSDAFIGDEAHHTYLVVLCLLYSLTALAIPFSVWKLEQQGPDDAVFAVRVWGLSGMFALQLPILVCYLQGHDAVEDMLLKNFFNHSFLATVDAQTWKQDPEGLSIRISRTILVTRLICMISAWAMVCIGIGRWTRLQVQLTRRAVPNLCCVPARSNEDSESVSSSADSTGQSDAS